MAVFKTTATALLLLAAAVQVTVAAPRALESTGVSTGRIGQASPATKDPKKDVETFGIGTLTPRPTTVGGGDRKYKDCPGAWDGPSSVTITLLETRADQLESEVKTPRRSVVESLGADNVRRLQSEFATAAAGFRGMLPDARRLAAEGNLPCDERKTILKRYTAKNAELTKKVAEGYSNLAQQVRQAITKLGGKADQRLKHSADEYESLGGTYLQAHGRAERQRATAAKLT